MFLTTRVIGPTLSREAKIALKNTSVWVPQITTFLVKNKPEGCFSSKFHRSWGQAWLSLPSGPLVGPGGGHTECHGQVPALDASFPKMLHTGQGSPCPGFPFPVRLPAPPEPSPCHIQHGHPHLPLHPCSVLKDRPTLPQVEPLSVPALCHQLASVPSLSSLSKGMHHPVPHPKKEAAVPTLFREGVLGWGLVLRRRP